jgi:hypothetical protein
MARGDVGAVIGCLRYYAGWADKIHGKTIDIAPDMLHYTRPEPVRWPLSPSYCPQSPATSDVLQKWNTS